MPPPPKNPGLVTFTVDGREIASKPGTNLIEAARTIGVEIPYYCYHPRLSVAANCRMCMVESSTSPKLVPACQTSIAEGMAVKTTGPKVRDQQKMVMEFLLLNHPVDCAICDQSGECKLQDYYVRYDHQPTRLSGPKILRKKRKALNETVVLDQERCVLCTRCVRFMEEVAKAPQLGVFGRGSHEFVDVAPHLGKLDSNYSGNIVDLCPVGALSNRDFRFHARAWFLTATPTVCAGCSRGCSVWADSMGQDLFRYRPRENERVNQSWMCDQGRKTYASVGKHRVPQSLIGRGADARETPAPQATKHVASSLKPLLGHLAIAVSPMLSNEDLLAALALARDGLGAKTVFASGRAPGASDFLLVTADKNPNRRGLEWIARGLGLEVKPFEDCVQAIEAGAVRGLLAFGQGFPGVGEPFLREAAKLELFVVLATNEDPITAVANAVLAASTHLEDEGTFTQHDGLTQRFRRAFPPKGASAPVWKWAVDLAAELGVPMLSRSARDVFMTYAPQIPELAGYNWDAQAPVNQARPGRTMLATAADGRPAGWREAGIPNTRGLSLPPEL